MVWCSMARLYEKNTWMKSRKPRGLNDYFEHLLTKQWNDHYEHLVSMGSIKRLINKSVSI